MESTSYLRTDLAVENSALHDPEAKGVSFSEKKQNGITLTSVIIHDSEGEKQLSRPMGKYITLTLPDGWENEKELQNRLSTLIAATIKQLLPSPLPQRVLVVGLGNRSLTADAIGPFAAEHLTVTGHIPPELLERHAKDPLLFAFSPGVVGKTGIETGALIKGAIASSKADCLIAIDALAASSVSRLGKTVQLSDTGITPGSGVGNHRSALTEETLGIPVIALGVPFVVSSATLVLCALEKAGITQPNDSLLAVLEEGQSYFVTPKDADFLLAVMAKTLAQGIEEALHPHPEE